jgi:hypothetical protein
MQQGWQCPECKTVYAPHVDKCECTKQQKTTATVDVTGWTINWKQGDPVPMWYGDPPGTCESISFTGDTIIRIGD